MEVAILWLINEKGEILLAKRAAHMSSNAGMWGPSVSGKIDTGETDEQAAVREANEELGIDPFEVIPIHHLHNEIYRHTEEEIRKFSIFYARVSKELATRFKLEPNEVEAVKWVSLGELQKLYATAPSELIISHAKTLWNRIFYNLETAINQPG